MYENEPGQIDRVVKLVTPLSRAIEERDYP